MKSTPGGDSDRPRMFPDANKPRTFSKGRPRVFPTYTEQEQEQKDIQQDINTANTPIEQK